ncbi:CBS domain-containing protein [Candidatus Methanoprimaticola sp. MG2]|uniref:CBS domain-containing protein n=1 Tax=Candidatus Methanoprimaticola sp. MG2 TaxID=3228838 RepID=UPI0039C716F7
MKFPPISEIKRLRKSLDITQASLAKESGVSQSTIAKIEGGRMSASYGTVVKLFEALDRIKSGQANDAKAIDFASQDVVSVESTMLVHMASDLMRRAGYSQLPVIDKGVPVGSISERVIFDLLRKGFTMDELSRTEISRVMSDPFPVVSDTTSISTVTGLMVDSNAVLVSKKGVIVGMITNSDMLKLV